MHDRAVKVRERILERETAHERTKPVTTIDATRSRPEDDRGLAAIKAAARQTWALGDFAAIAERELWPVGERILKRLAVRPGETVLDIGCGTGNAAIRAALAGGRTVGVDLTPEMLVTARHLAARAGVAVEWKEGDAEDLPIEDQSIDVVVSTFGCEFAPRHDAVAREIARVLRPGGRMGLCVWPPNATMGRIMRTVANYLPAPPSGAEPPLLWGDEDHVRGLFAGTGINVRFEHATVEHEPFESAEADVEYHATRFGPLIRARQALETSGRWDELPRGAHRPPHRPDRTRVSRHTRREEGEGAMTEHVYDAIVVGARCAGAPTAMLLARKGYDVLVIDRAHFPSDTVSTHLIHPNGIAAMERWGLLDRLIASGCPPVTTYSFDFGPILITGRPAPDGRPAYCPRRTVLDALLVDAARESGAEIREGFTLESLVFDDGHVTGVRGTDQGTTTIERARVVIGADGAHSRVATAANARSYRDKPTLSVGYYSYWSNVADVEAAEWVVRPRRGFGAFPTNDGLTMLLAAWPHAELSAVKTNIEANYHRAIEQVFGDRLGNAHREERIIGGGVPNRFRVPYGPGWALVGDAGYLRDPVTAHGITDAFLDAEQCAAALDAAFRDHRAFDAAMADYHEHRDARVDGSYEFTTELATLEPPPPEMQQLLSVIDGNTAAMDEFAAVFAGELQPADFLQPDHIASLVS